MADPFQLEVDGQLFEVQARPDSPGHYDLTWLTGPNPGYGFTSKSSDATLLPPDLLKESIRSFLAQIDPDTGYIE
jgi:hypothetical protein